LELFLLLRSDARGRQHVLVVARDLAEVRLDGGALHGVLLLQALREALAFIDYVRTRGLDFICSLLGGGQLHFKLLDLVLAGG